MEKIFSDIVIIGGGASGLACAISAAEKNKNKKIIILEQKPTCGKKILATGNGKCNLTNMLANSENYHGSFKNGAEQLLLDYPVDKVLDFFAKLGLLVTVEGDGRVYPYSKQASTVSEVLLSAVKRYKNITLMCNFKIESIVYQKQRFTIKSSDTLIITQKTVIACGGKSSPKLGSDGSIFSEIQRLGHTFTKMSPALCPLLSDDKGLKILKGVRAAAKITLLDGNVPIKQNCGEVQFTQEYVSGICVFDIAYLVKNLKEPFISVSYIYNMNDKEILNLLKRNAEIFKSENVSKIFLGILNKSVAEDLIRYCSIKNNLKCSDLSEKDIKKLMQAVSSRRFKITGIAGFENSQVTCGGIKGDEINSKTLESTLVKGLYFCGEVIDINADCGGYNLQFAFASGIKAGKNL